MALSPDEFDRPELRLPPAFHRAQAAMAAERGEEYDPVAFEDRVDRHGDTSPALDDAEPVTGEEARFAEWLAASE